MDIEQFPSPPLPEAEQVRERVRRAIAQRQIALFRQQILTRDGIKRFEVLSRLRGDGAYLPATDWIDPVLADPLLSKQLDLYVAKTVLHQGVDVGQQAWLNVCGHSIDREFVGVLAQLIQASKTPPSRLCFEVTEQAGVICPAELHGLRKLGVDIALDDVGAGYSNWAAISNYPLTWIKIDGTLVASVGSDDRRKALVAHYLTRLGKALELGVVAEWVETSFQVLELCSWGVDGLQGYNVPRQGEGRPKLWIP